MNLEFIVVLPVFSLSVCQRIYDECVGSQNVQNFLDASDVCIFSFCSVSFPNPKDFCFNILKSKVKQQTLTLKINFALEITEMINKVSK